MPTVPKYEQSVAAQVRPGFQTVAPTADQLGANARFVDAGLGQGLNAAAEAAAYLRDQQAAQQALNAEAVATAKINDYVSNARRRTGANAWGISGTADADLTTAVEEAAQAISDPAARQTYIARMRTRVASSAASVRDHEFDETKKTTVEAARASTVAAIDFGVTNYKDQNAINDAAVKVRQGVALEGQTAGWTPERAALETSDRVSKLHAGVIGAMIAGGNTSVAAEYLEKNTAEIDADTRTKLQANLRTTTDNIAAQNFADDALAKGETLQQSIVRARAELTGDAEERAAAQLKLRFGELSQAREFQQKEAADGVLAIIAQGKSWTQVPAELWNSLGGEQQMRIKEAEQSRVERAERIAEARAGRAANLATKATADAERQAIKAAKVEAVQAGKDMNALMLTDPDTFVETDLSPMSKAGQTLSEANLKFFSTRQEEMKDPAGRKAVQMRDQAVASGLKAAGISGKKDDDKKRQAFTIYVDQRIKDVAAAKGRALTFKEMRSEVEDSIVEGTIEDGGFLWFDKAGRRYEAGSNTFTPKAADAAGTVAPAASKPAPAGPVVTPKSQAEFDRLPKGTPYRRADGSTWTKE